MARIWILLVQPADGVKIDGDREAQLAVRRQLLEVLNRRQPADVGHLVLKALPREPLVVPESGALLAAVRQLDQDALGEPGPVALALLDVEHLVFLRDELLTLEQILGALVALVEAVEANDLP